MRNVVLGVAVLSLSCASAATSQELVYTPVNPSFGGSPFNSSHLLGIAEIHRPDPPQSQSLFGDALERSQTEFFARQLESRILSRLSLNITEAIFGEGAEPSGEFSFGDTTLSFETLLDGTIVITIINNINGETTTIEVPAFLAEASGF